MTAIPLIELFSSIQGEGPLVGVRQLFMRLPKCNLSCPYCDTPTKVPSSFKIEICPGSKSFKEIKNDILIDDLLLLLQKFIIPLHHSISITGGEPLLWSDELAVLLPEIKKLGINVYLETNGTLPDQLDLILDYVDYISMDIKLPFYNINYWSEHRNFLLKSFKSNTFTFVKIVLDSLTDIKDLEIAREIIAKVDKNIITILQPVTPVRGVYSPKPHQILEWQLFFLQKLNDVRVIPQTHVLQGQL